MLRSILLVADGFEFNDGARRCAIGLGRRFGARIMAAGVIDSHWRVTAAGRA
jgi:hypothetical protein